MSCKTVPLVIYKDNAVPHVVGVTEVIQNEDGSTQLNVTVHNDVLSNFLIESFSTEETLSVSLRQGDLPKEVFDDDTDLL